MKADSFIADGHDVTKRIVYIGDADVDEDCSRVLRTLHILVQDQKKPITAVIQCHGGNESDGMAIYDAIATSKCHVTGLVYGIAASMGSVILQACDHRIMTPRAQQMIHYGTIETPRQTMKDVISDINASLSLTEWMQSMYHERVKTKKPNIRVKQIRDWLTVNTWFSAQESVDNGLADEVYL